MPSTLDALAQGLLDGGATCATNFPGFYSHQLFARLGGTVTSANEKSAYEVAWGASLAGKRSVVALKNVGLNAAADPFLNSLLVGVNAGLSVVVFDDVEIAGSQSAQDSRHYRDFFGGLWLEPYSVASAYELARASLEWSERFRLPVVIRLTNQVLDASGAYTRTPHKQVKRPLVRDHRRFVVHPINARFQADALEQKNQRIQRFVDGLYARAAKAASAERVLVFGNCEREVRAAGKSAGALTQIYTYPIPRSLVAELRASGRGALIFEQGSPYALNAVRLAMCDRSACRPFRGQAADHSDDYIVTDQYERMFRALAAVRPGLICGDLGRYTKDTLDTIDACLCLGASLSVGVGAAMAGVTDVFCVTGDAAFLHSGKSVLPEAVERGAKVNAIVICNGGSQGTGGQRIPGELMAAVPRVTAFTAVYEQTTEEEFRRLFAQMKAEKGCTLLYVEER